MHSKSLLGSTLPVFLIALLLSGLAPVAYINLLVDVDPEVTFEVPNYGIQLTIPKGWDWFGDRGVIHSRMKLHELADAEMRMNESSRGQYDLSDGNVWIHIYSKMPFTGVPLTNYSSEQEVYDNLRMVLEEVKNNPLAYFEQYTIGGKIESYHIADYGWYGPTAVDGQPAVELKYKEYLYQKGLVPDEPLPESTSTPDIVVYKAPYLYWLEFNDDVSKEDYKTIVDGFQFL